ncbi:MAG: Asp-tRNA(Asn)/Glu-tRNA(Gln) amidotransferase GatCAB subunit B, partial [Alphaproteobacteria bacterium]
QVDLLESGGAVDQETRLFDATTGTTRTMRSKEDAHDYRYFPDPDLLPLRLDPALVDRLRAELPELPDAKKKRFMDHYGLSGYEAGLITADDDTAQYYEAILSHHNAPKLAANWLLGDVFGLLNKAGQTLATAALSPSALADLLRMLEDGQLSGRMAKDVLAAMVERGVSAAVVVAEQGLSQISDTEALNAIITRIIAASPTQLADYRAGKDKLFGYFVGQVMKETGGKANPAVVNDLLRGMLGGG